MRRSYIPNSPHVHSINAAAVSLSLCEALNSSCMMSRDTVTGMCTGHGSKQYWIPCSNSAQRLPHNTFQICLSVFLSPSKVECLQHALPWIAFRVPTDSVLVCTSYIGKPKGKRRYRYKLVETNEVFRWGEKELEAPVFKMYSSTYTRLYARALYWKVNYEEGCSCCSMSEWVSDWVKSNKRSNLEEVYCKAYTQ